MDTQPTAEIVADVLSELQPQSPASSTPSADDAQFWKDRAERENRAAQERARERGAYCLGGFRAADDYRAEKFVSSPVTAAAFAAAQAFDSRKDNLYLCGPTGSGKSHLAAVAARRAFLRPGPDWAERVRTVTPMEISRELRACEGAAQEEREFQGWINQEVLVIDDLGVAKDTEFLLSALYEIVNGRYQYARAGLIVTSNLNLDELSAKLGDDRIASRLIQMCRVFNLAGAADYRVPPRKI